jgi:hypothetical protein
LLWAREQKGKLLASRRISGHLILAISRRCSFLTNLDYALSGGYCSFNLVPEPFEGFEQL